MRTQDVLCAMGIVESSGDAFGLEAAGVLCRIGPDVKNLRVGDRVMFLGHSSFATHTIISEQLCARMPDDLNFEDGATMPCVFSTSIYSLFNIGGLQKGQVSHSHSPPMVQN
jgi:NADPH:quinone reductase-like Zn-dependent oxidoreductase